MAARIIDGKAIAARVRGEVAGEVERFTEQTGRPPGLATVLVGDDPASAVYVGGKQRACAGGRDGRRSTGVCRADASFEEVAEELRSLNADAAVSGVLLQLPLPDHLDGAALTAMIDPDEGRGRADPRQRRAALARAGGPASLHTLWA